MDSREAVRINLATADFVMRTYLEDFTDEELMTRPAPAANTLAWQLGHLIVNEHQFVDAIAPGKAPRLPAGFAKHHAKSNVASNDPGEFCAKDSYLGLWAEVRRVLLEVLDSMNDADFEKPAPEWMRPYAPTVGHAFVMQGVHESMHSGQFAVARRLLGKPVRI